MESLLLKFGHEIERSLQITFSSEIYRLNSLTTGLLSVLSKHKINSCVTLFDFPLELFFLSN